MRRGPALIVAAAGLAAGNPAWTSGPAGVRQANIKLNSAVLPGGRVVAPAGKQIPIGPGPSGMGISASGGVVVAENRSERASCLTLAEDSGGSWRSQRICSDSAASAQPAVSGGRTVSGGAAIWNRQSVFISEGSSGRIGLVEVNTGRRRFINLNEHGGSTSYAGELALDAKGGFLYAADEGRGGVAVIEARSRKVLSFAEIGARPVAMSLSPSGDRLYVVGVREDEVRLFLIDVSDPSEPKVREGLPLGNARDLRLYPAVVALETGVYIANPGTDSVLELDAAAAMVRNEIPLRLDGAASLKGAEPSGIAYDDESGRLLVAERGVNAVAVIDPRSRQVLGHIPAGWAPTRVAAAAGRVFVLNSLGMGRGPNGGAAAREAESQGWGALAGGSVSVIDLSQENLAADTGYVLEANGLGRPVRAQSENRGIRHVVLIVKGDRTFDDIFGDVDRAGNGPVMGDPSLARLGSRGYVDGRGLRLSIKDVDVTPNHHALARQWTLNDNFYAAGDDWETLASYLAKAGRSVLNLDSGGGNAASDQDRASRFIRQMQQPGATLPDFVLLRLPNDGAREPDPQAGYPYGESYVADNDLALGRILEFLSSANAWPETAVFITQSGTADGLDHIDRARTVLLCAGPWAKKNYVSHINSDFAGLRKTILGLLRVAPETMWDAAASGVEDCLTHEPEVTTYKAVAVDSRVFQPKSR